MPRISWHEDETAKPVEHALVTPEAATTENRQDAPVQADGRPTVKISDNPSKAQGPAAEVERYKRVFGVGEQMVQPVVV